MVSRLARLVELREQFRPLARQLVEDVLTSASVPQGELIVEIGAGLGELRRWLPPWLLDTVVHTEPLDLAIETFRGWSPEAQIRKAAVEALPFETGAAATVLGLCVLDIVPDGPTAAREIARVLRPGGLVIHLLDMTTELAPAFAMLGRAGVVPLPNVFTEPADMGPTGWPEDLLLVSRTELEWIRDLLRRKAHPLAPPLTSYLTIFERRPLAAGRAVAEYNQLANDASHRELLRELFRTTYDLATPAERQTLGRFRGRPASSARFFASRLKEWFSPEAGFEVLCSDVLITGGAVAAAPDSPFGYFSHSVGETRRLPAPPPILLDGSSSSSRAQPMAELGVFVFVARRIH